MSPPRVAPNDGCAEPAQPPLAAQTNEDRKLVTPLTDSPRDQLIRRGPRMTALAGLSAVILSVAALSACSGPSPGAPTAPAATSPAKDTSSATYQLHMDFFSQESHLSTPVDPQVFVPAEQ